MSRAKVLSDFPTNISSGTIGSGVVINDPIITQTSSATGDVYYRAADGTFTRLAAGAADTVLTSGGAGVVPTFAAAGSSITSSGSAPLYACRAWVNFIGASVGSGLTGVRDSANISSIADRGTGQYTVNIDVDMNSANFAVVVSSGGSSAASEYPEDRLAVVGGTVGMTAGSFMINCMNPTGVNYDAGWVMAATFDD